MVLPTFDQSVRCEILGLPGTESLRDLLELESREFEAVLGQPMEFAPPSQRKRNVWQVNVQPGISASSLHAETENLRLISRVRRPADFAETLQLLHSLAHSPTSSAEYSECRTYAEVAARISSEIANTYPYFTLRGLSWDRICSRYSDLGSLRGGAFWHMAQRWVAELGDAHTAVRAPGSVSHPPYRAEMTLAGAALLSVPDDSRAFQAGVRVGWLMDVDSPDLWLATTGASPQQHAEVAARRFMTMGSAPRTFSARDGRGRTVEWQEPPLPAMPSVSRHGPTLRVARFERSTPALLCAGLRSLSDEATVVLDLRGNTGGNLVAADACRRMLIREPGEYGSVRYSNGRGSLSAHYPIWLNPKATTSPAHLRILVDSMTYSAAEDFLQPLADLDNVSVEGGPTGGGSGRPRTIPLMGGYTLRVSTAITYTTQGAPIELKGLNAATLPRRTHEHSTGSADTLQE